MNTSETISKISTALLKAQRSITFAVKDAKNPQFKSTYADLGSVIDACKPALNEAGISFVQMLGPSDHGTLALTTRLMHESGEWIESTATCPLVKNDPQGYGSATTYMRRYSLAAAVGLYQDDDDGNAAVRAKAGHSLEPLLEASIEQERQKRHGVMGAVLDDMNLEPVVIGRLQKLSEKIMAGIDQFGPEDAFDFIQKQGLNGDEETYLWSLLPSKVRTAIKAVGEKRKPVVNRRDTVPAP